MLAAILASICGFVSRINIPYAAHQRRGHTLPKQFSHYLPYGQWVFDKSLKFLITDPLQVKDQLVK